MLTTTTVEIPPTESDGWWPDLNAYQRKLFDDPTPIILCSGEKGGGKTHGCVEKIVRHLYEEENALGWAISPTQMPGEEGMWYILQNKVAPAWEKGARVRFEFGLERKAKHNFVWIANRHGGASKLVMFSVPYSAQVRTRVKGPEPSIAYVEEITDCTTPDYFRYPAAQLGRRSNILGPQQFLASCNPKGPSHWVYKLMVQLALDGNPRYRYYHFPFSDNSARLPDDYQASQKAIWGSDGTLLKRLVDGVWVDAPTGASIFRDYFIPEIHVRGDAAKGVGLMPVPELPIIISYDLGPVNFCCAFSQIIPVSPMPVWMVFDEINFVGKPRGYHSVVPVIMSRMDFWKTEAKFDFLFEHIADDTAYNTFRQSGSVDAAEFERLSGGAIRFKACYRGNDSVASRVRMAMGALQQDALLISALCTKTIESLTLLERGNDEPDKYDPFAGLKPKRSPYLHPFDALTYGMMYYHLLGKSPISTRNMGTRAYACGSN